MRDHLRWFCLVSQKKKNIHSLENRREESRSQGLVASQRLLHKVFQRLISALISLCLFFQRWLWDEGVQTSSPWPHKSGPMAALSVPLLSPASLSSAIIVPLLT